MYILFAVKKKTQKTKKEEEKKKKLTNTHRPVKFYRTLQQVVDA